MLHKLMLACTARTHCGRVFMDSCLPQELRGEMARLGAYIGRLLRHGEGYTMTTGARTEFADYGTRTDPREVGAHSLREARQSAGSDRIR